MSPKTLIIAAVLSAGALTTLPAVAAEAPDAANPGKPLPLQARIMFNLVDVNGDGAIDQNEMTAFNRAVFVAIDVDGDGKLTAEEFTKVTAQPRARIAQFMGRGGPRGMGDHGPRFHRGPRDGRGGPDGRQGQLEMPGAPDGQMPGMTPQPQMGQDTRAPADGPQPQAFASLDANGDGVITADEFANGAPRLPIFPQ